MLLSSEVSNALLSRHGHGSSPSTEYPDRLSIVSSFAFKGYRVVKLTRHLRLMPRLEISGAALFSPKRLHIMHNVIIIVLQIVSVHYCVECQCHGTWRQCHTWRWCQWCAIRSLGNEHVALYHRYQRQRAAFRKQEANLGKLRYSPLNKFTFNLPT